MQAQIRAVGARLPAWPITLFLISLVLPFFFQVGPLLMTANRLMLAVSVLPCLFLWLRGRAGPARIADFALLGMWAWITLSLLVLEGYSLTVEASGIRFIETIGAYLLARCFIRDADSFRAMVSALFWLIAAMLPFAIYEALTGQNLLLQLSERIWPAHDIVWKEPRWGLDRVQGLFSHPILYGVFCGGAVGLSYYVLGHGARALTRITKTAAVSVSVLLALSSGPLTALFAQLALIGWDRLFHKIRQRWIILTIGVASMILLIEIVANRTTPELFISYFAFDSWTASNRLRIWDYGSLSVANHPWLGIGFGDWERPEWMSPSMDMFWLVSAVRNGLPAAILLQLAFFSMLLGTAFKSGLSPRAAQYRTGFVICMVGFFLGGWTVDYWKNIYVFFMFLLGSGAWILEAGGTPDADAADQPSRGSAPARPAGPVYSRPRDTLAPSYTRGQPAAGRQTRTITRPRPGDPPG